MDLKTSEQNITDVSVLTSGLAGLEKFMLSDRFYLPASALTEVCPSMTGLMLWITSFNRYKMFLFCCC